MEIVNTGSTYRVYDESLKTYDKLPPQVYSIGCSSMSGFYLEKHPNLTIGEEKIYGTLMELQPGVQIVSMKIMVEVEDDIR